MAAETNADPKLELGHVLFIDIVGYSKLLSCDPQKFKIENEKSKMMTKPKSRRREQNSCKTKS